MRSELDTGVTDFRVFVGKSDLLNLAILNLKHQDCWGVIVKRDSALGHKSELLHENLLSYPLILNFLCAI